MESNSMACGSISKTRVLLLAYKQQACYAVGRYDSKYRRDQKSFRTYTLSATSLRLNCYLLFQKDQPYTCICTSTRVALFNICVTRANMRNVFYYTLSEYAHCPQQVHLLLTHSM